MKSIKYFLVGLTMVACTKATSPDEAYEPGRDEYPVIEMNTRPITLHRQYVGDIQAVRNVQIYARVKGYLEQIYVDEGQEVKKGQVLFRINSEEYQTALASAKANLQSAIAEAKSAELEVNRVRGLVEKNVVSETELEVAKARYDALAAKIEAARSAQSSAAIHLEYTNIRAPFDGVIDRIPYKMGSLINEGTLLTTVSDISAVNVYFKVSEREYLEYVKSTSDINSGTPMEVQLHLADGSEFPNKGRIETLEGEFDEGTGSIAFRARFVNANKILKHGSSGTVQLKNDLDGAILVPQRAVFEIQDKSYVYVVDANGKVSTRSFVPSTRIGSHYVVQSGLSVGEKVVYEGTQSLKDGMTIQTHMVKDAD